MSIYDEIYNLIKIEGGEAHPKELSEAIGISHEALGKKLRFMRRVGVLRSVRKNTRTFFAIRGDMNLIHNNIPVKKMSLEEFLSLRE